jgi:hypothetical protein
VKTFRVNPEVLRLRYGIQELECHDTAQLTGRLIIICINVLAATIYPIDQLVSLDACDAAQEVGADEGASCKLASC